MKYTRTLFRVLLVLGMFGALVFARELENGQTRYKTASPAVANGPGLTTLNINNIEVWLRRDAAMPPDGANGACADYPKGITNLIYAEGMVWGARVHDGTEPVIRVGGSTYASGMKAGKILGTDGNHWQPGSLPGSSEVSGDRHVWRVRTDWKSADLAGDAASFFQHSTANAGEVAEVVAQYEYDWLNWPATDGAPYNDLDGDGMYTPATWDALNSQWINGDIPGFPGADQTLWTVANDLPYSDTGGEVAPNAYGSPGIGIEEQLTMWGYNFPASFPLGNIQFKRARMIYAGRIDGAADSYMDTAYFSQWSDPDLGTYTDDYVGFDLDLSLAYVYNGNTLDATYNGVYGMAVPAGGYDFLQGPKVDGVPLGMTTGGWFGAGSNDTDPDLEEYGGTLQWWNLLEGYRPRPDYPERLPWIDNVTGLETKTPLAGDPVTGEGDIDGIAVPPGDRRLLMNSGPFHMALGDTQDVVIALIGAVGGDNLSSITVLKYFDIAAQYAYDNAFDLPSAPAAPSVVATSRDKQIILNWGGNVQAVAATEEVVNKGFAFEGYKIYQLPNAGAAASEGKLIAIYDVINGVITITEAVVDEQSGLILDLPAHIGGDTGIKRYLEIGTDAIKTQPLSNDIPYYFGISAYSYLPDHANSPFKSLESSMTRVEVRPSAPAPGTMIPTEYGDDIETTHSAGTAGGGVSGSVVDPLGLTGHDYKVWYDQQHYYLDVDGDWKPTAEPDAIAKLLDVSPSTVTGSAVVGPAGTIDLHFSVNVASPDYNYAAGALITVPGAVINSASSADGFAVAIQADGESVLFGDLDMDGGGDFAGGESVTINVTAGSVAIPIAFDFEVYDDAWAHLFCDADGDGVTDPDMVATCDLYGIGPGYSVIANAAGSGTIDELGYSFQSIDQWNLFDVSTGMDVVTAQTMFGGVEYTPEHPGGVDLGTDAGPVTDGFQLNVDVGFAAPSDFASYNITFADGTTDVFSHARASAWYAYDTNGKPYIFDSYADHGWGSYGPTATAWDSYDYAADGNQHGTQEVSILQNDVEFRFTGVLGDPIGTYTPIVEGGSMALMLGARGYDLGDHPENPNPGTNEPFFVRIPFEVWDTEADKQISIGIYDRLQAPSGDMQAINPNDRMYVWILNDDYDATLARTAAENSNLDLFTWNLIFWNCVWTTGDVLHLVYDNPIQHGSDEWTFGTTAATFGGDVSDEMVDMINVFPNPYYGYHALETTRRDKYVRFNHLPQKADIRIFNMGGVMVRKIEKDDATQNADWDLTNQYALPVASGIYIAHIDLPDVGKEKILKIALIQEEQILLSY